MKPPRIYFISNLNALQKQLETVEKQIAEFKRLMTKVDAFHASKDPRAVNDFYQPWIGTHDEMKSLFYTPFSADGGMVDSLARAATTAACVLGKLEEVERPKE
jgi:hypothetical protein